MATAPALSRDEFDRGGIFNSVASPVRVAPWSGPKVLSGDINSLFGPARTASRAEFIFNLRQCDTPSSPWNTIVRGRFRYP